MFCLPYFWYVRVSLSAFRYVLSGSVYSVYCRGSPLQVLWIWRGWNFGARRCFVRRFDEFFRAYSNVEVARQTLEKKSPARSSAELSCTGSRAPAGRKLENSSNSRVLNFSCRNHMTYTIHSVSEHKKRWSFSSARTVSKTTQVS